MLELQRYDPTTPREQLERIALILRNEGIQAFHSGRTDLSYGLLLRAGAVERDAQAIAQAAKA